MLACGSCSKDLKQTSPDGIFVNGSVSALTSPDPIQTLSEVESRIEHLESYLAEQHREKALLRRRVNALKSFIIKTLPSEILSTIFAFYLHDSSEADVYRHGSNKGKKSNRTGYLAHSQSQFPFCCWQTGQAPNPNPFPLGAVCRRWRDVAWSTPQLWNVLSIQMTSSEPERIEIISELVGKWLTRSRSLPLTVFFSCTSSEWYDREQVTVGKAKELFDLVVQHSGRWKHLQVHGPISFVRICGFESHHAPKLEFLGVSHTGYGAIVEVDLGYVPNLKGIDFSGAIIGSGDLNAFFKEKPRDPAQLSLNTANITRVHLTDMTLDDVWDVLAKCPQLTRCELFHIYPDFFDDPEDDFDQLYSFPPSEIITLPSLVHLRLSKVAAPLLAKLAAPKLQRLLLDQRGDMATADIVIRFLTRSGSAGILKALFLKQARFVTPGGEVDETALVRMLEVVPSLTRLFVFDSPDLVLDDSLLQRLSVKCGARDGDDAKGNNDQERELVKPLLPKLKVLEYAGRRTFEWLTLFDLLCSRIDLESTNKQHHPHHVQRIKLVLYPPLPDLNLVEDDDEEDALELLPRPELQPLFAILEQNEDICVEILAEDGTDLVEKSIETHLLEGGHMDNFDEDRRERWAKLKSRWGSTSKVGTRILVV